MGIVHQLGIFCMTIFHCLDLFSLSCMKVGKDWYLVSLFKSQSISFVGLEMVNYVIYNFLNHENFIACILKIHVTAAEVPCTSVHIFFKEAVVVYMLFHGTF